VTNRERVLDLLRRQPGLTDSEIVERTGIGPHQQVNQICRVLAAQGFVRRELGDRGRIVNWPVGTGRERRSASAPAPTTARSVSSRTVPSADPWPDLRLRPRLVLFPCSKAKSRAASRSGGPGVTDSLPAPLSERLTAARRALASTAQLDDATTMPACQRYTGSLYEQCRTELDHSTNSDTTLAILSGGYGLLLHSESIGWYEQIFHRRDWPRGLIEECLVELVRARHCRSVVAFAASTTEYAGLIRATPWETAGVSEATLFTPISEGGGAQRTVPEAAGQALAALLTDELAPGWVSRNGLELRVERLR
jgi:hypothetical protein